VTRVVPFAVVAVLAQASLALPPATQSMPAVVVSVVLLLAVAAEFLLPWARLPAWLQVLVPLTYTGSVLALILAAGATSGVGIVILIPLIWTALFHRPWESGCVVAAIMLVQVTISLAPVVDTDSVIIRRVLLWGALGTLISVAAHGLRERISRWQEENARLHERLREVTVMQDRERIANDLRDKVIQQIFGAGLALQGAASLTTEREVRRRLESSVADLDRAVRLVRQAIFGLETRLQARGLRQDVLDLCGGLTPAPEVSFSGPVDRTLNPGARAELLGKLREALGLLDGRSVPARVSIAAGEDSCLAVVEADLTAGADGAATKEQSARELTGLRDAAARAGARIDIEPGPAGTRLAWRFAAATPPRGGIGA
jgi:signal transduction histidine kinase